MKISMLFMVFAVSITSCHKTAKSGSVAGDYMVVGWTGGFAGYGVHNYYLISLGQLKKDVSQWTTFPDNINQFDFSEVMPASRYDSVKDLLSSIPTELLGRNNADIGTSAPDMGFTDVRTSVNGVAYRWRFEGVQDTSSQPIQQFLAKARKVFQ